MSTDPHIVILTGAGISAESGLGTFRDAGGLWTRYPLQDVATPEGFARDPDLVHEFYNMRRRDAAAARPNAAHHAISDLAARQDVTLITQNVDDLHERAGYPDPIHMHGALMRALCLSCSTRMEWSGNLSIATPCPRCEATALRPDIVWFGEVPYHIERIAEALSTATHFVSIGTSGQVWPAAGFAAEARAQGARTVELNLEASEGPFDEVHIGPATKVVPEYLRQWLG